ncbi:MAG: chemotaxis protein CheW [Neomegalonema sp.]|nr:chemotaxis protein CheW [Neomegalonema sp.]
MTQTSSVSPSAEPIALVSIADTSIALPSAVVCEVVGWPKRVTPSAGDKPNLLGYFPLRKDSLPLYDLPAALNLGEGPGSAHTMVAIVDIGAGRVGLAIDGARGFASLSQERLAGLKYVDESGGDAPYRLFSTDDSDDVSIYLDQENLAALPGMTVSTTAQRTHGAVQEAAEQADPGESSNEAFAADAVAAMEAAEKAREAARADGAPELLCFEWRDLTLAIDIRHVREIVTAPPFQKLRMMSDVFLGQARIRGEDVAIVDLDVLLRRPKSGDAAPPLVLYLDIDGRRVGAPATNVRRLLTTRAVVRADFPQDRTRGDVISATIEWDEDQRALLVDAVAISEQADVKALADKLNSMADRGESAKVAASAKDQSVEGARLSSYIKMKAGGSVYADLRRLVQLLEIDRSSMFLTESRAELAGYITYRGAVAPVLDLARHLGAAPHPEGEERLRIALAQGESGVVGMIVDTFESIEHLQLNREQRHLKHQAELEQTSDLCRPALSFLTARDRSGAKTIKFVDLEVLTDLVAQELSSGEAALVAAE